MLALEPRSCKYDHSGEMNIIPFHLFAEWIPVVTKTLKQVQTVADLGLNGGASSAVTWGKLWDSGKAGTPVLSPAARPSDR